MSDTSTDGSGAEGAGQLRPSRRGRSQASGGRPGRKPATAGAAARSGSRRRAHTGGDTNGRGGGGSGGGADRGDWPRILVQSLGAARILIGDRAIGVHSELLLGLLLRVIYSAGMSVPRGVLLNEFWPGQSSVRQRGNLRQTLYKLRGLGVDILLNGETVELARSQVERSFCVTRDRLDFDRDVMRGSEPFGLFLAGYVPSFSQFEEWMEETREVVHGEVRRILVEVLRERRLRADWAGAEAWSRWLLQFDVLNEEATLSLAECLMVGGSKAEAVALLDRYMAELGQDAGDIRLPAQQLRRRLTEGSGVRRRKPKASSDRHFVGREEEMALLAPMLRRARWHDGSATLIHGPSGIGKTRLLQELGKVAQLEGYVQVHFDCRETDLNRPLGVLLELLPGLLNSPGALGCSPESMEVLRRLVGGGEVGDKGQALPQPIALLPIEGDPESYTINAASGSNNSIRNAITDLVSALAEERPLYVTIDDAHWLDSESFEVISDIIQRVNSLRICLLVASHNRNVRAESHKRLLGNLKRRELAPLTGDAIRSLAKAIGEDYSAWMDPETEDLIVRKCEGVPYAIHALTNHWIETGRNDAVPSTLVNVLEHRLTCLSQDAVRILQCIHVLGRFASLERVIKVTELPSYTVMQALEELEDARCFCPSTASAITVHDMIGQFAAQRLSPLTRAALHTSVGHILELEYLNSRTSKLLVESLHHYAWAGDSGRIAALVLSNDEVLSRTNQPRLVLSAIESIDSALLDDRSASCMQEIQARINITIGEYGNALAAAPGGYTVPDNIAGLDQHQIHSLLWTIDAAHRADALADRSEMARICCAIVDLINVDQSDRSLAAEIGLTIAANICDPEIAKHCFRILEHGGKDIEGDRNRYLRLQLLYHTVFGDLDISQAVALEVVERAKDKELSAELIQDMGRAGYALRVCGLLDAAKGILEQSYNLAISLNASELACFPAWQLAQIYLDVNDHVSQAFWTNKLHKLTKREENSITHNYLIGHYCHVAIAAGETDLADRLFEDLQQYLPRIPTEKSNAYLLGLELGICLLDQDTPPDADLIAAAIEKHKATARFGTSDFLTYGIAESLSRQGKSREALSFINQYVFEQRRERTAISAMLEVVRERVQQALEPAQQLEYGDEDARDQISG